MYYIMYLIHKYNSPSHNPPGGLCEGVKIIYVTIKINLL
jgi:hypothetical protein